LAISYHQKDGNVTILGDETSFEGTMEFSDNLIITGNFTGKIFSENGSLVIEKKGVCHVDSISADSIVVAGQVTGDSNAVNKLEMLSGSTIIGNIKASLLRIADNVEFKGTVTMLKKLQDIDIFSVSSSDYKKMVEGFVEIESEEV
jgi:cytoskeletal protein CcmA (bactofilin family)